MEITSMFQCHVKDATCKGCTYDNCITSCKEGSNLRRFGPQTGSVQSITSRLSCRVGGPQQQTRRTDVVQTYCCPVRHASGRQPGSHTQLPLTSIVRWTSWKA